MTKEKGRRNTYTGILGCEARCEDCDWETEAKNALANAARHADAHPTHTVHAEQMLGVTYNRKTDEEIIERDRHCAVTEPHPSHERAVYVRGNVVASECPGVIGPAQAPPPESKPWF